MKAIPKRGLRNFVRNARLAQSHACGLMTSCNPHYTVLLYEYRDLREVFG